MNLFLTIFPTFENLEVVKTTLPCIIAECERTGSKLIVHDSSNNARDAKWRYLRDLRDNQDFFLILSDNLSMAHARNMCLSLGQEMYVPDYICILEDDHGLREGFISEAIEAMKTYYGKTSPNNLRFGLFTGCGTHHYADRGLTEDRHGYPKAESKPGMLGGANSCCRCAPTSHWNNVLKGYD